MKKDGRWDEKRCSPWAPICNDSTWETCSQTSLSLSLCVQTPSGHDFLAHGHPTAAQPPSRPSPIPSHTQPLARGAVPRRSCLRPRRDLRDARGIPAARCPPCIATSSPDAQSTEHDPSNPTPQPARRPARGRVGVWTAPGRTLTHYPDRSHEWCQWGGIDVPAFFGDWKKAPLGLALEESLEYLL